MKAPKFIFHQQKCVGCDACIVACVNENGVQEHGYWRRIYHFADKKNAKKYYNLSMACNHCAEAPCLKQCPANAISRSEQSGIVLIDEKKCIGCTYCIWNCPYEAPVLNTDKGIVEKCHFCYHRQEAALKPACAEACPTGALDFADKNNTIAPDFIPLRKDPKPSLIYLNDNSLPGPETDPGLSYDNNILPGITRSGELKLTKEWPLILFTILIAFLGPMVIFGREKFNFPIGYYMLAMAIGTYLSLFHLGRKFLFWRALINIRNSRLSREILFFTLFGISLLLDILIEGFQSHWHLLTIVPLLFSVDQLYKNLQEHWKIFLHPDQVFLISLSLSLFLLDIKLVLLFVLTFRLLLAFFHLFFQEKKQALLQNLFYFRIILLISCLFFIGISQNPKMTFYLFCLSEILGRILFYKHLSIPNVENKMKKLVGL